jgi:hypothetical protein
MEVVDSSYHNCLWARCSLSECVYWPPAAAEKDKFSGTPRTPAKDCVLCTPAGRVPSGTPRTPAGEAVLCTLELDGVPGHCYTMNSGEGYRKD